MISKQKRPEYKLLAHKVLAEKKRLALKKKEYFPKLIFGGFFEYGVSPGITGDENDNTFNYQLQSEYVRFDHKDNIVIGDRFHIKPGISWPLRSAAGFLILRLMIEAWANIKASKEPKAYKAPIFLKTSAAKKPVRGSALACRSPIRHPPVGRDPLPTPSPSRNLRQSRFLR